jgi:ABC-type multidrug transport system permease subunit
VLLLAKLLSTSLENLNFEIVLFEFIFFGSVCHCIAHPNNLLHLITLSLSLLPTAYYLLLTHSKLHDFDFNSKSVRLVLPKALLPCLL